MTRIAVHNSATLDVLCLFPTAVLTLGFSRCTADMSALSNKLDGMLQRCGNFEEQFRDPALFPAPEDVSSSQPTTLSMRSKLLLTSPSAPSALPGEEKKWQDATDLNPAGSLSLGQSWQWRCPVWQTFVRQS